MAERLEAVLVKDTDEEWATRSGTERSVDVVLRVQTPFQVMKGMHDDDEYEKAEDDVIVYGPVYVGDSNMLDRHSELVEMSAIIEAWKGYQNNPVILYNHSKTYGVIGKMLDVKMGEFEGVEGEVPIGRAVIDGGEEDITRKIRKGMLKAFSIGFIAKAAVKECKDEDTCYMKFTEIDWLETSVVDVPASPNAIFNVEKHIQGYEDRGDSIAILFGKSDDLIDSEAADDREPMEESKGAGECEEECTCGGKSADPKEDDDHYDRIPFFDPAIEDYSTIEGRLELVEAFIDVLESKSATVITPFGEGIGQGQTMTDSDLLEIKAAEAEEEEALPEEEATEEAPVEEEAEALPEEAVTLEAEATEEESATTIEDDNTSETIHVLVEVVKNLAALEGRLSAIEGRLDTHDKSAEEISALKSALEEKDATIETLTQEKEAAEAEATIEAEVAKRVASTLSSVGVEAPTATPERKSIAPAEPVAEVKRKTTDFDPLPEVSPGMNGLGDWLAKNLAKRG